MIHPFEEKVYSDALENSLVIINEMKLSTYLYFYKWKSNSNMITESVFTLIKTSIKEGFKRYREMCLRSKTSSIIEK